MAVLQVFHVFVLLVLAISWNQGEAKTLDRKVPHADSEVAVREKRAIDPLSLIGLVVSVGATIQGAVCTFTDVCGGDELTQKLEKLEEKLDAIQSDAWAYIREGLLSEGYLRLRFGGLIFGRAYYQNFTVYWKILVYFRRNNNHAVWDLSKHAIFNSILVR